MKTPQIKLIDIHPHFLTYELQVQTSTEYTLFVKVVINLIIHKAKFQFSLAGSAAIHEMGWPYVNNNESAARAEIRAWCRHNQDWFKKAIEKFKNDHA